MISAGKTAQVKVTDIMVGRKLLCKEDPKTPATSACSKQLIKTVAVAKKGLTPQQKKLWEQMVFGPAVLNAKRFAETRVRFVDVNPWAPPSNEGEAQSAAKSFSMNVKDILTGKLKFKGLFGKNHKWSDALIEGAKLIKKIKITAQAQGKQPGVNIPVIPGGSSPAKPVPRKTPVRNMAVNEYGKATRAKRGGSGVQLPGADYGKSARVKQNSRGARIKAAE